MVSAYLSVMKHRRRQVRHVERRTPRFVDLLYPHVDEEVLVPEHVHRRLRNESMDGNRLHHIIVQRQRSLSTHLNLAIVDDKIHMLYRIALVWEYDVAKVKPCRLFLDSHEGKVGLDDTIDLCVCRWLVVGDAFDKRVQMRRIDVAELIAQDQRSLLRLVERSEGGRLEVQSGLHVELEEGLGGCGCGSVVRDWSQLPDRVIASGGVGAL
jgi:hypothetical protein